MKKIIMIPTAVGGKKQIATVSIPVDALGEEGIFYSPVSDFPQMYAICKEEDVKRVYRVIHLLNMWSHNFIDMTDDQARQLRSLIFKLKVSDKLLKWIEYIS